MREKAAAVRAQERVARACIAEGEQKIVRFLRVQQGGNDRRERLAGAEAEEHRVRSFRARQQRAALRVGGEKGKRVGGVRRDGLVNIRCRHENLLKKTNAEMGRFQIKWETLFSRIHHTPKGRVCR